MRIALIIACGITIAGAIFFFSYRFFDEVAAASTGYNATAKGLFGWDYEYAEYDFIDLPDGTSESKIIASGRRIRSGHLVGELVVSLLVGLGLSATIISVIAGYRASPGEQAGAGNPIPPRVD